MPMCDIYIPPGVLAADTEKELVRRVSELLVTHELRRIVDLMDDPEEVRASHERAASISRMFVHRTDTYVAGEIAESPHYKFEVSIPQGQIDDVFRQSIARDILGAVIEAESADGLGAADWPHVGLRTWVFVYEVPDGSWASAGRFVPLRQIVDFVAPGLGELAEERWAGVRREDARTIVALAEDRPVSA